MAWQDELLCDVAVFNNQVLEQLSPEQQERVEAVKTALDLIASGRLNDAERAVAEIPRKAPMSQWRLLVRGLKHWFCDELIAATKAWSRLDPNRRPARIAFALTLARRDDLAQISGNEKPPSPSVIPAPKFAGADSPPSGLKLTEPAFDNQEQPIAIDKSLLLAAKVVRRMRVARPAIKAAISRFMDNTVLTKKFEDLTISSETVKQVYEFAKIYRPTEPELVEALELTALQRAVHQPYLDIFKAARDNLRGLPHDRKNYLRSFLYLLKFEDSTEEASQYLRKYLITDLPFNEEISPPLRSALQSVAWLREATAAVDALRPGFGMLGFFEKDPRNERAQKKTIRRRFAESIKAYPANRDAHKYFTDWQKSELDDRDLTKAAKEKLQSELLAAMEKWAKADPTNIEPRQFLAETLLENERLEEANPHVQWLISTRPESPLLRALPWKLKLLEAIQLSRRKSGLPKVPDVLDELEAQWPTWLSRQWLPYFRATLVLRKGDVSEFHTLRDTICQSNGLTKNSIADACMMLGAAQKMKVPAADLKPLRAPVDAAAKNTQSLTIEELITAGSFFGGMLKAKIAYPAFRMHGGKLGRELMKRIERKPSLVESNIKNQQFLDCLFWFSESSFWSSGYESKTPAPLFRLKSKNANVAAAHLNATIRKRWIARGAELLETADFLRQAARTEQDAFNRYWFVEIADKAVEKDRELQNSFGLSNMFANMFGGFDQSDEPCDCPNCRLERADMNETTEEQFSFF